MTPASPYPSECHDTVTGVTERSGKGTARQTFRAETTLWQAFGEATQRAGTDRSEALRAFMRWYLREGGAELPERPDRTD